MYNNIGKKIKGLANAVAVLGIILSSIGGITLFFYLQNSYYTEELSFVGIIVALGGSILSWIGSFLLYGFGELIYQTKQIKDILDNSSEEECNEVHKENYDFNEKVRKLKEWRERELITQSEYTLKLRALMEENDD